MKNSPENSKPELEPKLVCGEDGKLTLQTKLPIDTSTSNIADAIKKMFSEAERIEGKEDA